MGTESDLELGDGRTLHAYDAGGEDGRLAVFWHHGSPNIGAPPAPLFSTADPTMSRSSPPKSKLPSPAAWGVVDDDLAGVCAWGFDSADVVAPVLFLRGGRDRDRKSVV